MFREAVEGLLAEDEVAVDLDLEDATAGGDQFGLQVVALAQLIRQTGGTGLVVSNLAVLDGDLHGVFPF